MSEQNYLPPYSVLMSVYSKEKASFLEEAIQSIFLQGHPCSQFVLVCDGPLTDELDAVIQLYEERLTVVRLDHNQGLGVALQAGLERCENEIVLRADSDDVSVPDRAEKEIREMLANDLDIVSSDVSMFWGRKDNKTGYRALPTRHGDIVEFAKRRCPFNHPAVAFRKSAVLKTGGYQSLPYREDWFLWVRMILADCKVGNLPEDLVYMRYNDDLLRRRKNKAAYKSSVILFRYMREHHFISRGRYLKNRFLFWGQKVAPVWFARLVYKKKLHNGRQQ